MPTTVAALHHRRNGANTRGCQKHDGCCQGSNLPGGHTARADSRRHLSEESHMLHKHTASMACMASRICLRLGLSGLADLAMLCLEL